MICGGREREKPTSARWNIHFHSFKADASLTSFLALSDSEIVAGRIPNAETLRPPKNQKDEEAAPVKSARLNGSVVRWRSCWVRVCTGSVMLS
jgi:hypothetical protein